MRGGLISLVSSAIAGRAARNVTPAGAGPMQRKSYANDPMWVVNALRFRDKPTGLSYEMLRMIAKRDPIVAAIMRLRLTQLASLRNPWTWSELGAGFAVQLRDVKRVPTKEERKTIEGFERFFHRCGSVDRPQRDNLGAFLKKAGRDSLCLDQLAVEVIRDRLGRPVEFFAVDGGSMRLVADPGTDEVSGYVQLVAGTVAAEFEPQDIIWAPRHPRTDLLISGYGYPEIEDLVNVITSHLYADDYNQRAFTQGAMPKGVFLVNGAEPSNEMMEAFARQWEMRLYGVAGAHMIPWLSVPGGNAQFVPLGGNARDMEWEGFQDYLVNTISACFLLDPAEVNHPNRGTTQSNALFGANSIEARLTASRDRGLRPFCAHFEEVLTERLLWQLPNGEDFVFRFKGLDREDAESKARINEIRLRTTTTVNELRAEEDKAGIGPAGDIICNPEVVQMTQWLAAQNQQAAGGAQGGAGTGGDGAPPHGDDGGAPGPVDNAPPDGNAEDRDADRVAATDADDEDRPRPSIADISLDDLDPLNHPNLSLGRFGQIDDEDDGETEPEPEPEPPRPLRRSRRTVEIEILSAPRR